MTATIIEFTLQLFMKNFQGSTCSKISHAWKHNLILDLLCECVFVCLFYITDKLQVKIDHMDLQP